MESIKESLTEMTMMFNSKMNEFQQQLHKSPSPTTTISLAAEFISFKSFIILALNNLQKQVEFLGKEFASFVIRSRRKILLLHGLPEEKNEDVAARVTGLVAEHLNLPNFSNPCIKSSYCLGRALDKKPRPIVVKFSELGIKNKMWFAKTKLKGTGLTLSEFMTKIRHQVFLTARQRFGIGKCWTQEGAMWILAPDGDRYRVSCRIECLADVAALLNNLSCHSSPQVAVMTEKPVVNKIKGPRTKRVIKKQ